MNEIDKTRLKIEAAEREIEAIEKVLRSFVDYKNDSERGSYLETCFKDNPFRFYIRCSEGQLQEEKREKERQQQEEKQLHEERRHLQEKERQLQEKENELLKRKSALQRQGGGVAGKTLAQSSNSEDGGPDSSSSQFGQSSTQRSHDSIGQRTSDWDMQFRMVEDGEYLHVELPLLFLDRYRPCPAKIYIRGCYKDLYEIVIAEMLGRNSASAFLFTGIPGIGKSVFLIYFLFRFLNDERFPDKRFVLEFESGNYHCFVPKGAEDGVFNFAYFLRHPYANGKPQLFLDVPIFCDMLRKDLPLRSGKWLFIFSSPYPERYRERMKENGRQFTLPTWNRSELLHLQVEEELWINRFNLVGGVPRIIFGKKDPEVTLESILVTKGSGVAESFFKHGFGNSDLIVDYTLFHINPPKSRDGDGWHYDGAVDWSFASQKIFEKIAALYRPLVTELIHGSSACYLFKKICLWLNPLAGDTISARSLTDVGNPPIDIALPAMRLLHLEWKKNVNDGEKLEPNIFYQPSPVNLELGNAFCWLPGGVVGDEDGASTLVVLQITVGSTHSVEANDLNDIVSAFPEQSIARKLLVFVTPQNGKLNSEQPLRTRKNEVAPSVVGFEQYICRRILHDVAEFEIDSRVLDFFGSS